ncbi:hypothetical protein BD769DRAFT_1502668 [Suillus cothurnatus]|nr:hypothetical protein BD769DRAFT_1502668 [Suillus cothurnatus]
MVSFMASPTLSLVLVYSFQIIPLPLQIQSLGSDLRIQWKSAEANAKNSSQGAVVSLIDSQRAPVHPPAPVL